MECEKIEVVVHEQCCMAHMALAYYSKRSFVIQIQDAKMDQDCIFLAIRKDFTMYMFFTNLEERKFFLVKKWITKEKLLEQHRERAGIQSGADPKEVLAYRDKMHSRLTTWAAGEIEEVGW